MPRYSSTGTRTLVDREAVRMWREVGVVSGEPAEVVVVVAGLVLPPSSLPHQVWERERSDLESSGSTKGSAASFPARAPMKGMEGTGRPP